MTDHNHDYDRERDSMAAERSTRLPLTAWLVGFAVLVIVRIALRAFFPEAPWYALTAGAALAYLATLAVAWTLLKRRQGDR